MQGKKIEIPTRVISSIQTQFGVYDPSTFQAIKGQSVNPLGYRISKDATKLTKDELVSIFYIPETLSNGNPAQWQSLFSQYLNVAYNRITYLFEDVNGKIVKSDIGKVKLNGQYNHATVLMDMGLYRNIKYLNADRKVGYFFRIQLELDLIGVAVLDISDIFSIAVSAKTGVIQGSIETLASGLSGKAMSKFLVPLTSLNSDNIQRAIINVAILNNKIAEDAPDVIINPELFPEDM
jgi:hypothetical protein